MSQWIYNGMYSWGVIPLAEGTCVYLQRPEHRGLIREEGQVLLSASRLPFPAAVSPEDAAREKAYSDRIRALEDFGGLETDDIGTINGLGYQIHFMALGAEFAALDRAQHKFAKEKKHALTRMKNSAGVSSTTGSKMGIDLKSVRERGPECWRIVVGDGRLILPDGTSDPIHTEWIRHIPSGTFVFFDELVSNPQQARKRFSGLARKPQSSFYVPRGSEHEQRDFGTAYSNAISKATTPVPEHFRHIGIDNSTPENPCVVFIFEYRNIMPGIDDFPEIALGSSEFRDLLKPKFHDVFSRMQ